MTPKEKAKQLHILFSNAIPSSKAEWYEAKQCALIAVDEMIEIRNEIVNTLKLGALDIEVIAFLEEVKQEIDAL